MAPPDLALSAHEDHYDIRVERQPPGRRDGTRGLVGLLDKRAHEHNIHPHDDEPKDRRHHCPRIVAVVAPIACPAEPVGGEQLRIKTHVHSARGSRARCGALRSYPS
jgi:hypothetical protein